MERLSPALHASVRRALRQAWELDDAEKAEKLIRNLAQRLERDAPGVSKSILEGLDEILTEVDPVSWTPELWNFRSPRWQESTHPMRRSSGGR
jgi:hypothetical protein